MLKYNWTKRDDVNEEMEEESSRSRDDNYNSIYGLEPSKIYDDTDKNSNDMSIN